MSVKSAIEAIKPGEKLIRDTEMMLRGVNGIEDSRRITNKNKFRLNKLVIAACVPIIAGVFSVSFWVYKTPVSYVSFDINPSMELEINRFDRVVDVNYFNNEAKNLIPENELYFLKPSEAINLIVKQANNKGYLSNNKTNVIAISVHNDKLDKSKELRDECVKNLDTCSKPLKVISESVNGEIKKEADSLSLSFGKLSLIKYIQQLDKSATVEGLKDDSITVIMDNINYLTSEKNSGADANTKEAIKNSIKLIQTEVSENTKIDNQLKSAIQNLDATKAQSEGDTAKTTAEQASNEADTAKGASEDVISQAGAAAEQAKIDAEKAQKEAAAAKAAGEEANKQAELAAKQAEEDAKEAKSKADAAAAQAAIEAEKAKADAAAAKDAGEKAKAEADAAAAQAAIEAEKAKADAAAARAEAEKAKAEADAAAKQAAIEAEKAKADGASAKAAGEKAKAEADRAAEKAAIEAEKAKADAAAARAAAEKAKAEADTISEKAKADAEKAKAEAAAIKAAAEAAAKAAKDQADCVNR